MARAVYISSVCEGAGKFFLVLGLIDLAVQQTARVGFFRPVIAGSRLGPRDRDIEVVLSYFGLEQSYEESFAWTLEEVRSVLASRDGEDKLIERVIERFKTLQQRFDFIAIEGSDFVGDLASLEFDFNALIARNLSIPLVLVGSADLNGPQAAVDALQLSVDAAEERGVQVLAVVVNKVRAEERQEIHNRPVSYTHLTLPTKA